MILVAGIGNVFFGDDAFGVEVVRDMQSIEGMRVLDVGIRTIHLAYELVPAPDLLVIVDTCSRGEDPGTLYLIDATGDVPLGTTDTHGMDLASVFAMVRALGGDPPRTHVLGCEPGWIEEGAPLSPAVRAAVPRARDMISELVRQWKGVTDVST